MAVVLQDEKLCWFAAGIFPVRFCLCIWLSIAGPNKAYAWQACHSRRIHR